jgi:hypothetical protein
MKLLWSSGLLSCGAASILAGGSLAAMAAPAIPDPCKLVTVAEIQQIVGPLAEPPRATDPSSGEITCTYMPTKGPDFIDVTLMDGDLAAWRRRNGGPNPASLPAAFGKDAFINPDFEGWADLYAKKGNLILRVTMPKGPASIEAVKAIAAKALPRL